MRLRLITFAVVLAIGVLAVMAWQRNTAPPAMSPENGDASGGGPAAGGPPMTETPAPQDAGIEWTMPKRWVNQMAQGMRLATYVIPAPGAKGEAAQCAVYYFGPGQGGSVDANIERWIGEFQDPGAPVRRARDIRGLHVTQVAAKGTYTAHAGGEEGAPGVQTGWTLLGAIVEGPHGPVFFKLTGPETSVAPAEKEFDALLASLRKK
jgi:hypothetical protein